MHFAWKMAFLAKTGRHWKSMAWSGRSMRASGGVCRRDPHCHSSFGCLVRCQYTVAVPAPEYFRGVPEYYRIQRLRGSWKVRYVSKLSATQKYSGMKMKKKRHIFDRNIKRSLRVFEFIWICFAHFCLKRLRTPAKKKKTQIDSKMTQRDPDMVQNVPKRPQKCPNDFQNCFKTTSKWSQIRIGESVRREKVPNIRTKISKSGQRGSKIVQKAGRCV